jgi:opacity protein-like surface antigen
MKYTSFLVCLILLSLAEPIYGNKFKKNNSFSVRFGYSMSNFTGDETTDITILRIKDEDLFSVNPYQKTPRKGLTFGIGYSYSINKQLYLRAEANYEEKGCIIKLDSYQIMGDYYPMKASSTFKLNYLSIPAYIRFYPGDFNLIYLEAGAYYSHALIINETGTVEIEGEKITYEHLNENINEEDLGITIGTGIELKVSRNNAVSLGVRYARGLMKPAKYHQMDPTEVYGQSISVGLSYSFKL